MIITYYIKAKETISLSYPNWMEFFMKHVIKHIKVKTVDIGKPVGGRLKSVIIDEFALKD